MNERNKIVKRLEEAYRRLIEFKKQKNSPLVVTRNGKVVDWIHMRYLQLPLISADASSF